MTQEIQQGLRFSARRFAIVAGLVLAVVGTTLTTGFLLLRDRGSEDAPQQAAPAPTEDAEVTMHVSCDMFTFKSLEKLVSKFPGRADVLLARVEGEPEVWLMGDSGEEISPSEALEGPRSFASHHERVTADVEVLEYFLGEGPSSMKVDQTSSFIARAEDGVIRRASAASGCGYVELTQGKTYVLFLRHHEEHPRGDMWGGIGVPIAFEVDGQELLAAGRVTPADFGWSTLADVRRNAEAVKAGLAAGQ